MEQGPSYQESPLDTPVDKLAVLGNIMQVRLAEIHGEDFGDFLDSHADGFRVYAKEHPEIFEEYKRNPDVTLQEISENIYH